MIALISCPIFPYKRLRCCRAYLGIDQDPDAVKTVELASRKQRGRISV